MKKLLTMLCMLTCVFGLTACGSTVKNSQLEQQKGENAITIATNFIVPFMTSFFDDDVAAQYQASYNVHELEALTEDQFAYILYMYSSSYGINFDFSEIDVEGNAIMTGITSFNTGHKTLGDIDTNTSLTGTYEISGDEIFVTVPLTGSATDANGNAKTAEVEVIFSNDVFLTVKSCTMNIQQTTGELMAKAGMDTLMGMGTVFSVLILISIIIWALGGVPKLQAMLSKQNKKEEMQAIKADAVDNTIAQIIEKEENSDDSELVAVIAAAVAAYEGAAGNDGFVVRSIRKRR